MEHVRAGLDRALHVLRPRPRSPSERAALLTSDALACKRDLVRRGLGERYHDARLEMVAPEEARSAIGGYLEHLAEHVKAGRGLLFTGPVDTGKTCALALVLLRACEIGLGAKFVYAPDLYSALIGRDDESRSVVDSCRYVQLLCIDDFGAAYPGEFPSSQFEGLCEYRQARIKATCVTTNRAPAELAKDVLTQRAIDRWRATCWAVEMPGESRRQRLDGTP